MLIKNTSAVNDLERKKAGKVPLGKPGATSIFEATISQHQQRMSSYQQEVEELRQEIERAGNKLEGDPTLANFKEFRDLLGKIAKLISNEAYQLEKVGGTPQNPRYFEVITVINAEADKLYNLIVSQQKDRMAITEKVIGIKGLVIDLVT